MTSLTPTTPRGDLAATIEDAFAAEAAAESAWAAFHELGMDLGAADDRVVPAPGTKQETR